MLVIPNGFIHRHARQYNEGKDCKDVFNACCILCFSMTVVTIGSTLVIVGYTGHADMNLKLSGFILLGLGVLLMSSTIIYKMCCSRQEEYLKDVEAPDQVEACPLQGIENSELPEIPVWLNVASPLEQHFLRSHGHRHGLSVNRNQFSEPSRLDKTVNGQVVTRSAMFGQVPKPRLL